MAGETKVLDQNGLSYFWSGIKPKFVSDVTYNKTTKTFIKSRLRSQDPDVEVVTATALKTDMELDNVGNFKAVSTVASQGLSTTEQGNARTNIDAASAAQGSKADSAVQGVKIGTTTQSIDANKIVTLSIGWDDISNKPDISGVYRYKGSVSTTSNLPTHSSSPAPVAGDVYNVTATGKNYAYVEYNATTGEDVWDDLGGEFSIDVISNKEIDTILAS
jgi:hypothetical protein